MPLNLPPRVRVLNAVMTTLLAADLPARTEMPDLRVRWARNRYTTIEERPCIAIAFVSDAPVDTDQYNSSGEMVRMLSVDLVADAEVESEASAEETPDPTDRDPHGLTALSIMVDQAMLALKEGFAPDADPGTPLALVADWCEDAGVSDDEELQDIDGRLVARANVLYRVSTTDPTVLFTREP